MSPSMPTRRGTLQGLTPILVGLVLGLHPVGAGAQTTATLTLEDAIARGLANSQRIAELEARSEAATASEDRRAADRLPVLSLNGGYTRTNHVTPFSIAQPGAPQVIYPDIPDNYRSRLDVQWPIYTAGRVDAMERAARAEREAAGRRSRRCAGRSPAGDHQSVLGARRRRRNPIGSSRRSLESIDAHVRDLRSRLEQGLIPPNDLLSAEAQQSRERLLAIETANQRGVSEADLQRLLGTDSQARIDPAATLEPPAPASIGTADALVAQARANGQSAARWKIAPEPRESASPLRGPSPSLRCRSPAGTTTPARTRGSSRAPRYGRTPGTSRSMRPGRSGTAAAAGRIGPRPPRRPAPPNRASLDFDRQVAFEVRQRRLEVDSSLAAIVAAADGVRSAQEAFRVVGERFGVGVATNTEVLDAQTALLQAQLDQTRALANARLADARLARAR